MPNSVVIHFKAALELQLYILPYHGVSLLPARRKQSLYGEICQSSSFMADGLKKFLSIVRVNRGVDSVHKVVRVSYEGLWRFLDVGRLSWRTMGKPKSKMDTSPNVGQLDRSETMSSQKTIILK